MTFQLDPEDTEIIVDVLQAALSDLGMEIADTDRLDYRRGLKRRRVAIERALAAMRSAA